jgi:hypothetical protein
MKQQQKNQDQDWRLCPYSKHHVKEYKKSDGQTVPEHCASNPSGKDELRFEEIQIVPTKHFHDLTGLPLFNTKLDTHDNFKKSDGTRVDVDQFDQLIRGWTQYWTKTLQTKLNFDSEIDANWIKVLIASESTFDPNRDYDKEHHVKKGTHARGLMQIGIQAREALQTLKGHKQEIFDYFIFVNANQLFNPSANICAGVRWYCHKWALLQSELSSTLKRNPTWEEACWQYKGIYHKYTQKIPDPEAVKEVEILKTFYSLLMQPKSEKHHE